ncbi:MAG: aminotransferase class V-fold PLP-dependent enzyme, partial [Bacteroidetes bacterium]|nr:aminotransferase class V-fold PLP-dependent enzyme [Bacteroidota bacterium]
MTSIYFDHHSTTPLDERVLHAMMPFLKGKFGNAASRQHGFGWEAEEAVSRGRKQLADLIGAEPKEIVFTSGATESNNLAIKGVAESYQFKGRHLISCVTEHPCVIESLKHLEKQGFTVTWITVDREGRIDPTEIQRTVTPQTILVSIMLANNEIGTIQSIKEISEIARANRILFHCDVAQAV